MPNYDGTGPAGKGPQTGRGLGPCSKGKTPRSKKQKVTRKVDDTFNDEFTKAIRGGQPLRRRGK